MVTADKQL